MNKEGIQNLILRQKIDSKKSDYENFRTALLAFSLLFPILAFAVTFYNSTLGRIDYNLIVIFLLNAGIYFYLYRLSKNSRNKHRISLIAFSFYFIHTGTELLLGMYPKDFLSFLSYSHLENTYSGGARTMNIVTLFIDLIPELYIFIRILIITVFVKAIITTRFLKLNRLEMKNNNG